MYVEHMSFVFEHSLVCVFSFLSILQVAIQNFSAVIGAWK